MLGLSIVEIIHMVVDGAAAFAIAIWDAVAASPKLQAMSAVFVLLAFLKGGAGANSRSSRSQ